jgi:hypothetical protein
MSEKLTCTFCGATDGSTHVTAVGESAPGVQEELENGRHNYSINFTPSSLRFELIKVTSLAHAFKNNPIAACENCEKVVWATVKEMKK